MIYAHVIKYLRGSVLDLVSAQHLVTRITWIAIEMAINWLIYCGSCMPRWPKKLWVYVQSLFSLSDLSAISLWLISGEEFTWKKSFNKARTIFSLSRQREGHRLSSCVYFFLIFLISPSSFSVCICAWPLSLWCHVNVTQGNVPRWICLGCMERCSWDGRFKKIKK